MNKLVLIHCFHNVAEFPVILPFVEACLLAGQSGTQANNFLVSHAGTGNDGGSASPDSGEGFLIISEIGPA
jgi:hypothetical protein